MTRTKWKIGLAFSLDLDRSDIHESPHFFYATAACALPQFRSGCSQSGQEKGVAVQKFCPARWTTLRICDEGRLNVLEVIKNRQDLQVFSLGQAGIIRPRQKTHRKKLGDVDPWLILDGTQQNCRKNKLVFRRINNFVLFVIFDQKELSSDFLKISNCFGNYSQIIHRRKQLHCRLLLRC
jgi:hypothetical protein